MKLKTRIAIITTAYLCSTTPALAASDYLLKLDGVAGEAASSGEILGFSWGMSNSPSMSSGAAVAPAAVVSPRDPASGRPTGSRSQSPSVTASQNTQSLRESPTRASTGAVAVAAGDLDGDGRADFIDAAQVAEVDGFTLSFDKASPVLAKLCANGTHFPKATIVARGQELTIENGVVSGCAAGGSTRRSTDGMPSRISMNVTVPAQTQSSTCAPGACPSPELVTVTITGQMKHTKTGHVTLLK
jgi:hypothetical protein